MSRRSTLSLPAALPAPPAGMSAAGVAIWKAAVAARPAAEWSPVDRDLLELYVRAALDVRRLDAEIAEAGETYASPSGAVVVHPLVLVRQRRERLMLDAAKKLRLSPCSRYTAKDVGRLHGHARKAAAATAMLDSDDLLAGGPLQ